jgi:threonine aldolase
MSDSIFQNSFLKTLKPNRHGLASDNHSGVHPRIFEAMLSLNSGHRHAYGLDEVSAEASRLFQNLFGPSAESHFVFNGTAANVLALSAIMQPYHALLTSQHAHIVNDECGAPERCLGIKVISVPSSDAKLTPESLKPYIIRRGDQHFSQVRAISITQPTELGTVYQLHEIQAISKFAKEHKLLLHMDGARIVNAVESLGCTFKEMTTDSGVDVLSLGGTKNGLLFGEVVVFLRPGLSSDFKFKRKQLLQLMSKTAFTAAQFLEFLGTDLWRENAAHANRMAQFLRDGLMRSKSARITQKTESNSVFVIFPREIVSRLREQMFFYVWDETTFECRLMTSWNTRQEDLELFLQTLSTLEDEVKL